MKRIIVSLLISYILFGAFAAKAYAEEALTAPVVQYKLINHDKIALRWDAVDGADGYYIYRTDVKTGKTFRYPSVVNRTENTIGRLSPNTEYIFSVAPIKKNGNKVTVGKRSSGTKLTTPKEWYFNCVHELDKKNDRIKKVHFYKENYSKDIIEEIQLGDIITVKEIVYYNGWYYVIGFYDAIAKPESFEWEGSFRECVARIKEDGTHKEILFDEYFSNGENRNYDFQITDDGIYICSYHLGIEETDCENIKDWKFRYYSDPKSCWLKKISFSTGEVESIVTSVPLNWFYCNNGYIYYEYDDSMTLSNDEHNHKIYYSGWYDHNTFELIKQKSNTYFCYRIKYNGKGKQLLSKHQENDIEINKTVCINDNQIAFINDNSIYTTSIKNDKKKKIYECKSIISKKIQIINGYIYFSERIDDNKTDAYRYCRIKTDGTGLIKQDKPFEWYY